MVTIMVDAISSMTMDIPIAIVGGAISFVTSSVVKLGIVLVVLVIGFGSVN